jgi:hypothetical protein
MKTLIAFLLLFPIVAFPQDPFQRIFSGQFMASSSDSDIGVDGGYIFCKNTIVKTDDFGNVEWSYNYRVNTAFQSIVKTFDNCYIASGNLYITGGLKKIITIKVDALGNLIWYKVYGGIDTEDEKSYSICETSDSNYLISGYTTSYGYGSSDIYLLKIDSDGNVIWGRAIGEEGTDYGNGVKQINDGNYIVAGFTEKSGMDKEIYLIKFDQNGDTIWTRTYGGINYDVANNFIQTTDGGFAIIGTTNSFAPGGQADLILVKTDSNGVVQWAKTFGGEFVEVGAEVTELQDHGFLLVGYTQSFGAGGDCGALGTCYDYYLIRTDQNGDTIWTKAYGRFGLHDWATGAHLTSDNGYFLYGPSFSNNYRAEYLIKTDSNGYCQCNTYNTQTVTGSPELETSYSWGRLSHGNKLFEVNMDVQAVPLTFDSLLCQPVSIIDQNTTSFTYYPNPAKEFIIINYPDNVDPYSKEIIIYNTLGTQVNHIPATQNASETKVDLTGLPAGLYFALLLAEGKKVATGKFLVTR